MEAKPAARRLGTYSQRQLGLNPRRETGDLIIRFPRAATTTASTGSAYESRGKTLARAIMVARFRAEIHAML
jgi:hypothetical protein